MSMGACLYNNHVCTFSNPLLIVYDTPLILKFTGTNIFSALAMKWDVEQNTMHVPNTSAMHKVYYIILLYYSSYRRYIIYLFGRLIYFLSVLYDCMLAK